MKLRLGIVGFGEFSRNFIELFLAHPDIEKVAGAEILDERREEMKTRFGVDTYKSFEEMLDKAPDLNSVAIFSQRHQHGPMVIQALKAGKHVFSAVPMGCTLEEIAEIIDLVKKTGLIYMMAETCYYFPCAIYCREKYQTGYFGEFVYGESQYYHDITEMAHSFKSVGDGWKRVAGIPPMYYSTHSMSMLFSAINDHPIEVMCMGYEDTFKDGIYGRGNNDWDNPFSNQSALLKMSRGGVARINEFRRVGTNKPSSYITGLYGTLGAYEGSGMQHIICKGKIGEQSAETEDVSALINSFNFENARGKIDPGLGRTDYAFHRGFSAIHNVKRLPETMRKLNPESDLGIDGHNGSHYFLADDFARAVVSGKLPPNNAWEAAKYTVAGIIAHESAMQGGKVLKIPFLGEPPADWDHIQYED